MAFPCPEAQWRVTAGGTLAYRCGGSAGLASRRTGFPFHPLAARLGDTRTNATLTGGPSGWQCAALRAAAVHPESATLFVPLRASRRKQVARSAKAIAIGRHRAAPVPRNVFVLIELAGLRAMDAERFNERTLVARLPSRGPDARIRAR